MVVDADHRMGVVEQDIDVAEGAADAVGDLLDGGGGRPAQRELALAAPSLAIDGKARAVGSAVGQRGEHGLRQAAELGLERRVFQEQADNAAHGRKAPE